ncbi:MAG: MMPL family transporter [Spirochaetaceae bacterium]|nr:MMPL family transporter [Spirochaetaceae bacterium]
MSVEADVESLLPAAETDEPISETNIDQVRYDQLAILVQGETLFTIEGLSRYSDLISRLGEELSAEEAVGPFRMVTMERAGSRLRPTTMSNGGIAPENQQDLDDFLRRLDEDPFTRGLVSSRDGSALVAYLPVPKGRPYLEQDAVIRGIVSEFEGDLDITVTGNIPFSAETERYLTRDALRLMAWVILTIVLSYYLGFRARRAMFLPVILVISGTLWSLGFMSLLSWKLTVVSIVSPPLVLTLGSSYSIHILSEYYRQPMLSENKRERIIEAVTGVSGTIVMASMTTITGLLCLLLATMPQTRQFAVSTSVGIFATALLSLSLFPAFLSLQKPVEESRVNRVKTDFLSRWLEHLGPRLIRRRWPAPLILIVLITVFGILIPGVESNTSPISYYPARSAVIRELKKFSLEVGGVDELTVTLTAPENEANFFLRPEILTTIYSMEKRIGADPDISHHISLASYLSFASKTILGEDGDFSNRGLNLLVGRMLLSGGNSPDARLSDESFSEMKLKLRIFNGAGQISVDENETRRITEKLRRVLDEEIPEGISWEITGMPLEFLKLSETMRRDFLISTLAALAAIGLVCTIAFRSLWWGFLAIVPMIAGIAATFILMTIFSIPLDMTTIMVSCVAIGVGVDDAIHFLLQNRGQLKEHPENPETVARESLLRTGRPIILTTAAIVLGLAWFILAEFRPIMYFGVLIVFTLSSACLATLFLLPPLAGRKRSVKIANR